MTANNRPWSQKDLEILKDCIARGLSAAQAGQKLNRSRSSCISKSHIIGWHFGGNDNGPIAIARTAEAKDAAYVARCIAEGGFLFVRRAA